MSGFYHCLLLRLCLYLFLYLFPSRLLDPCARSRLCDKSVWRHALTYSEHLPRQLPLPVRLHRVLPAFQEHRLQGRHSGSIHLSFSLCIRIRAVVVLLDSVSRCVHMGLMKTWQVLEVVPTLASYIPSLVLHHPDTADPDGTFPSALSFSTAASGTCVYSAFSPTSRVAELLEAVPAAALLCVPGPAHGRPESCHDLPPVRSPLPGHPPHPHCCFFPPRLRGGTRLFNRKKKKKNNHN